MELTYPGIWTSLSLIGILVSLAGATLLAITRTHFFGEQMRRDIRLHFGSKSKTGVEIIEDGGIDLTSDRREFGELTWFLTLPSTIHSLQLPIDEDDQIKALTKGRTEEWDTYVNIIDSTGTVHEEATTVSEIREQIEKEVNRRLEKMEDQVTKYSWEILATGFLIQFVSYFADNFVTF